MVFPALKKVFYWILEEMEEKMRQKLQEGNEQLERAKAIRAKVEAEKKKRAEAEAGEDNKKEEGAADEGDKKEEPKESAGEDMPDIPNLSLN